MLTTLWQVPAPSASRPAELSSTRSLLGRSRQSRVCAPRIAEKLGVRFVLVGRRALDRDGMPELVEAALELIGSALRVSMTSMLESDDGATHEPPMKNDSGWARGTVLVRAMADLLV